MTATFVFLSGNLPRPASCFLVETEARKLVSPLPPGGAVAEIPNRLEYDEPTVMWRMRRADGLLCHGVIGARANGAVVAWFVNGRPLGHRDFSDWTSALRWSEQLQAQNWAVGWRLV